MAGTIWALTALIGAIAALLAVVAVLRRPAGRPALPSADAATAAVERRRAEMAEAEIRALRRANLRLHEQVDALERPRPDGSSAEPAESAAPTRPTDP